MFLAKLAQLVSEFRHMPHASIDLMRNRTVDNDPFYARIVDEYFRDAHRRHPKLLFFRKLTHGVALCKLPSSFDEYFKLIEAAARRNYKKAAREGCQFRRIQFNDHLDAIREVRQSAQFRQGKSMPASYLKGEIAPCNDPPSTSLLHDYPYFGVFINEKLVAYGSCLISGEICMLEHILGHAAFLEQNVVPFLIIEIAKHLYSNHHHVQYFGYGMYFGAGETLRRFKRKFGFMPHRVSWTLEGSSSAHCIARSAERP